ncbi:uncharacterized protein LOC110039450 [Phalaenopsis equestris]|uniref:uncharacterized protein LOC110039450 n=1 Tax=Phalaenopsis equestris TaxID=78828 RepID=UPI0009E2C157|nr:uncharacterized protein LOC110039450 [Phalaenopsis equestris]
MKNNGLCVPPQDVRLCRSFGKKMYSEPQNWMHERGQITIQCGCCYNFIVDKNGNPPSILRRDEVDSMNFGDNIPPHIDHHDFVRPFCTVSFISKCKIMFGKELDIIRPGNFQESGKIPLLVGSVLVLNGKGANLAKHCIPSVPRRRVFVTIRRMDDNKVPYGYRFDLDLERLQPLEL